MNEFIQKALEALENANISGYFEEMDKVEMSAAQKTTHNIHRARFIANDTSYNFHEQLRLFALEVAKKLENANHEGISVDIKNYKTPNIFELMKACYNDEDLRVFCMLHFDKVHDNFSNGMSRNAKLMALIAEAKKRLELDKMLSLVQEEHPQQYERFAPYW